MHKKRPNKGTLIFYNKILSQIKLLYIPADEYFLIVHVALHTYLLRIAWWFSNVNDQLQPLLPLIRIRFSNELLHWCEGDTGL